MKRILSITLALAMALTGVAGVAGASEGEIVLQVFHSMTQSTKQTALAQLQEAFTATHPNVRFENIVYNQGTDYFPQLQTAIASGNAPDVIMGNPGLYPDLINEGYAMDLTGNGTIQSMNLTKGDLGDVSANGVVYAFPIDFKTWGVFYNVKLFEELGIEVPTTKSEMLAVCEKLAASGVDPWIRAIGDGVYGDIEARNTIWPRAVAAGDVTLYEDLMSGKLKVTELPYFQEAVQNWADRLQWHRADDISNGQDKAIELFVAGEGAMYYGGTWSVGDIVSKIGDSDFQLDFFVAPVDEDPASTKMNVQVDQAYMVNPKGDHADIALQFMEFWVTDGAMIWSEATQMPLITGKTSDKLLPMVRTLAEIKQSGNTVGYGDFSKPFNTEFTAAFRKALNEFGESVATGTGMTVEQCLENMQAYFDDIIATNY
ncbi:MAG: extracellular solute-binding protein [Candidatus Limiplasma sp.]|nr:extracellular solute-binding protein [Candidatus Limiplasma sp.]